jgi:hypothetical protein
MEILWDNKRKQGGFLSTEKYKIGIMVKEENDSMNFH